MSEEMMPLDMQHPPALLVGEMNSCSETDAPDLFKQVQPHPAGFSFVRLSVQPGSYCGWTIPSWCIGRVLKPYSSSVCQFGDASLASRTIHASEVTVVPPNSSFRSVATSASEFEYVVLTEARFDQALAAEHADNKSDVYCGEPIFEAMTSSSLLATLFSMLDAPRDFDIHHAHNYVNAIVSDILRTKSQRNANPVSTEKKLSNIYIKQISEFIDANIDQHLTNEKLAQVLHMNEATFVRLFKATTNVSPYQFILSRRIERVRHLLVTTKRPIARIAFECGFSSQSHLTTAFKARVGITPKALRDRQL